MNKFKKILLGVASVLTLGALFVVSAAKINAAIIEYDYSYNAFSDAIAYENKGDSSTYTNIVGTALNWYAGRNIKGVDIDAYYFGSFLKMNAGKISQLGNANKSAAMTIANIDSKYLPANFDTSTYHSDYTGYVSGMKAVSNVTSLTVTYNNTKTNAGAYYLMLTADDTTYTQVDTGSCASLSLNKTITVDYDSNDGVYKATCGSTTINLGENNSLGYAIVLVTSGATQKNIQTNTWTTSFTVEQEGEDATFYDVKFYDSDKTTIINTVLVEEGHKATAIDAIAKWGYSFNYWADANGNEFDFDNTLINSNIDLYASYTAWDGVIVNENTLDLDLMARGFELFGNSASSTERELTGTIYTLLKGNTCYSSVNATIGDFGKSTAAIKTAGGLNNHQNGVSLTVESAGTLTVWAKNGSSSGERTFGLYKNGNTETAESSATVSSLDEFTLDISDAGTYELGSPDGSVYFYYISFETAPEVEVTPLVQEATDTDYTYVRFVTIVSNAGEISSDDVTFSITMTYTNETTKTVSYTPYVVKKITQNGEAYVANVGTESHTFDNALNATEYYVVYVIRFTTSKFAGCKVSATTTFAGVDYTSSQVTI